MLKSLEDFVSYSDFASRVRKIEKELKANSKSFHIEEQEKCFSEWSSCRHVISRLCAIFENSPRFQDFILQKKDEVSEICLESFYKSSDNADLDFIHLMKLITFLHRDGLIPKSDQLLDSILKLLTSSWLPPQTALLSGNTVVTILLKKSGQDPNLFHQLFKKSLQFSNLEIFQLSLLTGFMSVVPIEILLYLSTLSEENTVEYHSHLLEYLPGILSNCQKSSPLTFQQFYLLKLFASKVKDSADHLNKLRIGDSEAVFDKYDGNSHVNYEKYAIVDMKVNQTGKNIIDKENVDKIFNLCIGNVENQCKGVPDLCSDIYRSILASCQINWTSADFKELLEKIIQATLKSKWTQKSKYFQLQLLVPVIGITESVARFTDLGPGLATSLSANHITHAGVEVYKYFLNDAKIWETIFLSVLVEKVLSTNTLIRQNTRDYWLPATLKSLPETANKLQEQLNRIQAEDVDDLKVLAQLDILKICRKIGALNQLSEEQWTSLNKGLVHSNCDVRSAAFSIVCEVKKKGTPPSKEEMEIVLEFIHANSIEDNSRFRQNVLSKFGILMIRCRDFCTQALRKNKNDEGAFEVATFLDKLMKLLLSNLQPGGNYQRKISSFLLLNIYIDNFVKFKTTGANKCSGNGDPSEFLNLAHSRNLMIFFTQFAFKTFLLNTEDKMGDVRDAAAQVLLLFTPSNKDVEQIYERGLMLIKSARDRECESGATLLQLVAKWRNNQENSVNKICVELLDKYSKMLTNQTQDFIQVILHDAQHGTLTGLRKVLLEPDSPEYLCFDQEQLGRLISVLEQSVDIMLSVLSGEGSSEGKNPSFEESAKAINKVIQDSSIHLNDDMDETTIPESYQLVLSAVWHNIKSAALLGGEIVRCSPFSVQQDTKSNSLAPNMVQRIGNMLVKILTLCRHKGALEGTVLACSAFATRLVNADKAEFSDIPCNLIKEVLEYITNDGDSSVTRRSAGLPGLIQALLAADISGSLVTSTIQSLLAMAKTDGGDDQVKDTTACHALHILRGIVQNASVSRHVGSHIHTIMVSCLQAFESSSWSERNAALQLFGALAPRILGQKKLRSSGENDEDLHNRVSLQETDIRFPGLVQLLLNNLQSKDSTSVLVNASTVPILTLLARLDSSSGGNDAFDLETSIYHGVTPYLASPVIQVRILAARIYSEFSPLKSINDVLSLTVKFSGQTNLLHSYLLVLLAKTNITNSANQEDTLENMTKTLNKLYQESNCYYIKTSILKVLNKVAKKNEISLVNTVVDRAAPGFDQYQMEVHSKVMNIENISIDLQSTTEETVKDALIALNALHIIEVAKVEQFIETITSLLPSSNATILANSLTFLISSQVRDVLDKNPETALDVLEALKSCPEVASLSVKLRKVKLKSICLNSLMIQDDWAWFFGDTSEYVSIYVECSEQIFDLAHPNQLEDSRLASCSSLMFLLPSFNIRKMAGKMTPILQYGVVNCFNAALMLLQDEDVDVRNAATKFASKLNRSNLLPQDCQISTYLGIKSVILFGFSQLLDVAEMFHPIAQLVNLPTFPTQNSPEQKQLFKRGDGINVYEEPIYMLHTFQSCITEHCKEHSLNLTSLDVNNVLEILDKRKESSANNKMDKLYDSYFDLQVYEFYKKLSIALNLCQKENLLKQSPDDEMKHKLKDLQEKVEMFLL